MAADQNPTGKVSVPAQAKTTYNSPKKTNLNGEKGNTHLLAYRCGGLV